MTLRRDMHICERWGCTAMATSQFRETCFLRLHISRSWPKPSSGHHNSNGANGLLTITDPTPMRVMGAALHALGTEWSAKLDDMYKRGNKSFVMKCRYVEKVKLTYLWVTIHVNSFNLVESLLLTEGERQGQGAYSASWGPTLEQIACLQTPNSLPCLQHSKANRRPGPFFQ